MDSNIGPMALQSDTLPLGQLNRLIVTLANLYVMHRILNQQNQI